MPGKRISELTALSGAGSANNDDVLIFDTNAAETKRISRSQLAEGMTPDLPLQYYLGVLNSNPTQRLNGDALMLGDYYLDAVTKYTTIYNGSGWNSYASVIAAQAAAEAARNAAQLAETNAETAETNAETAETNAELAETNAEAARDAALAAQTAAELAEANAESARDAAFVNADVYADTTAGLAAVALGEQFQVVSGDEIIRYREDAGPVATEVARYPSAAMIDILRNDLIVQNYDLSADANADFFVNAQSGNDVNAGTSRVAAVQTLAQGRSLASTGQTLALFRGQRYLRDGALAVGQDLYGYGQAGTPPQLDARASLSGATWTSDGDGAWYTDVTLADATVSGGVGSNTTNFGIWFGTQFGAWKVGGADIAANIAAVKSRPAGELAFTIHLVGSTQQDIRFDTASTGPFRIYCKMPDGLNPTGKAVLYTNRQAVGTFDSRVLSGVELIGAFGKDAVGLSNYNNITTFIDCVSRDFGEHGSVGPANFTRHTAIGKARPGLTLSSRNQAGALINLFTNVFTADRVLTINGATLQNGAIGIYCHGSGNQGYRGLGIFGAPVVMSNVRAGIQCDVATGRLPMFVDGINCTARLEITEVNNTFACDGNWRFTGGGSIVVTSNPVTNTTALVEMRGAQSYVEIKDFVVTCLAANSLSFSNLLCTRSSNVADPAPTLILDNLRDLSVVANRLRWVRGASPALSEQTHLVLKNGTQLWDLADAAGRVNFPASLTVEAGCRFGWGDRTGPALETALGAAGVTHNISGQSTIVGLDGSVKSAPGWK